MSAPSRPQAACADVLIEPCTQLEQPGWQALRAALWPDGSAAEHLAEMGEFLAQPGRYVQFVAYDMSRRPVGLAEAALRHDYVNGTQGSPVAFLEGLYVVPDRRRLGVARRLVGAVQAWACALGCRELASDAALDNAASHAVHRALGFEETERVVYFCKTLNGA